MASPSENSWPRAFRMVHSTASASPKFWTHELYRGPDQRPVQILYSRTKLESEEIAHEFLEETVVGFDMEWPWQNQDQDEINVPLQRRIGLIQIASESKIGLFHIGLHAGQTPKDVLAPTLRKIIESEDITKTGVAILNADFARLRKWFDLNPRGAFELSHMHNLVTYGAKHPIRVTTRMKALTKLVGEHLGFPMYKGKVRTSNWSRQLNQAQIQYAAADAYAGVMLYHCMNAKRLSMDPVPPLPLHAERYVPMRWGMGSIIPVRLGPSSKAEHGISAVEFYRQNSLDRNQVQPSGEDMALLAENQENESFESEGNEMGGDKVSEDEVQEEVDSLLHPDDRLFSLSTSKSPANFEKKALARTKEGIEDLEPVENRGLFYEKGMTSPEDNMGLVAVRRLGRQLLLEQRPIGTPSKRPALRHQEVVGQVAYQAAHAPAPKTAPATRQTPKPTSENAKILFAQLSAHRKQASQERGCPPFVVAHNTLLAAISEHCPRNEQELRNITGIGKVKAELYGPAWLAIVNEFVEEQAGKTSGNEQDMAISAHLPTTPVSRRAQPVKENVHKASGGHGQTPPTLHTGLSFTMESVNLETPQGDHDETVIVISDESGDEGSAFGSPMRSPSPSTLKRKRELLDLSGQHHSRQRPVPSRLALQARRPNADTMRAPIHSQAQSAALTTMAQKVMPSRSENRGSTPANPRPPAPKEIFAQQVAAPQPTRNVPAEAHIFRNKLLAFNKRVTSVVVLSETTIEAIVREPPKTAKELLQIPNIIPFANACARQNQCLLTFISKCMQKTGASSS
ncbi:unnamed protein product [Discula destructiva]